MDKIPSISVIIPTYNRSHVIDRAIHSVQKQTYPIKELIVVDDGSNDGTSQHIKKQYPEIILIEQSNRGVSHARNQGIKAARGEWIALLDSDDEWLPEKLAYQFSLWQENKEYLLIHCDEIWIRKDKRVNAMKKHQKHGGWIYPQCLPLCCISPSAAVIHRSIFQQIGLFDTELPACEDYDFWLRFCSRYPVLFVEQDLLIKYGGHEDQLSHQHWGMDRFRIQALGKILSQDCLNQREKDLTLNQLKRKIEIMLTGAKKRNNQAIINQMQKMLKQWNLS